MPNGCKRLYFNALPLCGLAVLFVITGHYARQPETPKH